MDLRKKFDMIGAMFKVRGEFIGTAYFLVDELLIKNPTKVAHIFNDEHCIGFIQI